MNLNKQTITYIFIIIFIIITFIHLYKINNKHNNNNNDKENFADLMEDQNLQGFSVSINSMEQVFFGNTPNNKLSLKTIMNEKAEKTELSSLNNKVEEKASKTELNNKVDELNNKVDELNNKVDDAMPELSVISYAGSNPPTGWQLCDGENLEKSNVSSTAPINEKFAYDSNGDPIKTPDLRGRFILGSGKGEGEGLTNRNINETGGEENHTLTVAEMPSHEHKILANQDAASNSNLINSTSHYIMKGNDYGNTARYRLAGTTVGASIGRSSATGSNASHNNMPPYYVLTYIIKQPSPPTSS